MVINVLCESSLIELNNPFSNMTLDEAFNMFTENVNIILNEKVSDTSRTNNEELSSFDKMNNTDEFNDKNHRVNSSITDKINNIIKYIINQINYLWNKFIEFAQNFTSNVMKKFLSIGIDKGESYNLINNMKKDFTVTIKGPVVTEYQYASLLDFSNNLGRYDYIKRSDSVADYFSKFRYEKDYEYKITRQVGINAWNIIFNSKSKFVSEAIRAKNAFIKDMQDHKNIEPYYNEENDNTSSNDDIKNMAKIVSQTCKEEISVYRDYLKTCAKVLKAIIDHGGDSTYHLD